MTSSSVSGRVPVLSMGATLVRLLRYLHRVWRIVALTYLSLLLVLAANLAVPELIRRIIDDGISMADAGFIVRGGLGLVGLALGKALFTFLESYLSNVAAQDVAYDLRNALYDKIQSLSFSYHDHAQTGQLMTRATSDVDQVRDFLGYGVLQLLNSSLLLTGTAVILMLMNWRLAVLSLFSLVVVIGVLFRFSRRVRPLFRDIQEERGTLNALVQENLAGVRVVKAFAREEHEMQRFALQNERLRSKMLGLFRLYASNLPIFVIISAMGIVIVLWYGGTLVIRGDLTLGELVAFNTYLMMLMMPVRMVGFLVGMAARAAASAQRIFEILDADMEIRDRPGAVELPPVEGRVRFEHVSFSYYGGAEALHDVSFEVEPGQNVALLGATGSGKTTIINLIPRFYDVTSGRVTIDGYAVDEVTVKSLRRQIGIVLQDTALFSGTVRENIAYGCPEADESSIRAAVLAAGAEEFIDRLPEGYDTLVGERGVTLSGGQRQRIAIARALLLDPKILILDDSTSSVDVETEFLIQQALDRLMVGRTSFIIAQRLSTVQNADLILVLDRGRLVARGTHEELLESSPIYAELYHLQLGTVLEEDQLTPPEEGGAQPPWNVSTVLDERWL